MFIFQEFAECLLSICVCWIFQNVHLSKVSAAVVPQSKSTELCSSAAVVPQSKSTELCSSAAVVPQSKSTEMWSSEAPFHHDLWYFRHRTKILRKTYKQPTVAPLKSLKSTRNFVYLTLQPMCHKSVDHRYTKQVPGAIGVVPPPPPISAFKFRVAFLRMWYFKVLFPNFQHPLFLEDPFMSLLKLRTFGYTSPHGSGCSNPKNIGWMNNICNSLHVVSVFRFVFWGRGFLLLKRLLKGQVEWYRRYALELRWM